MIDRWARGEPRWTVNDGLVRVSNDTRAMLASQRLTVRPYSLSALQRFSACPYQFLLAAVYRLQPLEQPEPLQRLDPLTRGSLFHTIQAQFFRTLDSRGALPVTATNSPRRGVCWTRSDSVTEAAYDELVPAVDRVWIDEVASIAATSTDGCTASRVTAKSGSHGISSLDSDPCPVSVTPRAFAKRCG